MGNYYNRAKIEYFVPSSPEELEQVTSPHFTFHPPHWFHLRANKEEALFEAIADLDLTLRQDHEMPWIRAFSGPLNSLKSGGTRQDRVVADSLTIQVPTGHASLRIAIDFVTLQAANHIGDASCWHLPWHNVALRVTLAFTYPRIATLWWFHFR